MTTAEISQLVTDGWKSISRRWCTIARLPAGLDGRQALALHDPDMANRTHDRHPDRFIHPKAACEGSYMRLFADRDGNVRTLRTDEFRLFRKMGGQAAW